MMEQQEQLSEFEAVKTRLEEIAEAVDDENLSLDEALDLYEEAVKLGLQASDLLEVGIVVEEEAAEAAAAEGASIKAAAAEGTPAEPSPSSAQESASSPTEQEAPSPAEEAPVYTGVSNQI